MRAFRTPMRAFLKTGAFSPMTPNKTLLLAGTALLMLAATPAVRADSRGANMLLAQAAPQHESDKDKKAPEKPAEKPEEKGAAKPAHEAPAHAQPPKPAQAQQKPAEKAAPPQHQAQPKPAETKPAEAKPAEKAPERKAPEKPATQAQPQHEAPKAAQQPSPQQKAEPKREERRQETQKPETKPSTAAKPAPQQESKPAAAEKKPEQKPAAVEKKSDQKPAAQQQNESKPQAPAAETKPAAPAQAPAAQAPAPQKPAAQTAPTAQPPANNAQTTAPATIAQPTKPQSAQQFILPKDGKPTATIQDLRKDRHETREGNRTVITEGDRTIVKQDNRTIIRHNETQRFAVGARDVNVERHGNETTTIIVRPDGDRIINVTDERGNLIRRVRRERGGKEIVIIDERSRPRRDEVFIDLAPPVIHIPRERYIVELEGARPQAVYDVLDAPPVERIEQQYTVDQVRYSAPLRERMPRIDLDINFETGSWQLTPDQVDKLNVVAEGLKRAISKNPREVFLIEGHTDAVGNDEDNLSLSDRRAESVAVALTEQFQVPPENLVTQGYGEQNLKVQTQDASRQNRRVSVRRITPLIDKQAAR
jgi:outer membrane protein OmpA-like peptidoglycan-associated protein